MSKENRHPELKWSPGTILWGRLRVVGERLLPREEFDHLSQQDWVTWLTEPDPEKFPQNMARLKEYLRRFTDGELDLKLEYELDPDLELYLNPGLNPDQEEDADHEQDLDQEQNPDQEQ